MPNRILRDYTDSDKVDKISPQAETCFIRLIMKADDFGKFHGHPTLLKSALFPLKVDKITDKQMDVWMDELKKVDLIIRYEVNGKKYLKINDFGQRLRLMQSKFPDPIIDDSMMTAQSQHDDSVKGSRNEDEVEVETKEEEKIPPPYDLVVEYFFKKGIGKDEADKFYNHYKSNGWLVSGKTKMVDWHGAVGGWISRMEKFKTKENGTKPSNKPATVEQIISHFANQPQVSIKLGDYQHLIKKEDTGNPEQQ